MNLLFKNSECQMFWGYQWDPSFVGFFESRRTKLLIRTVLDCYCLFIERTFLKKNRAMFRCFHFNWLSRYLTRFRIWNSPRQFYQLEFLFVFEKIPMSCFSQIVKDTIITEIASAWLKFVLGSTESLLCICMTKLVMNVLWGSPKLN